MPAFSRVLKLFMRFTLLVIDEKCTDHVFYFVSYLHLRAITDELDYITAFMDAIREYASEFLI